MKKRKLVNHEIPFPDPHVGNLQLLTGWLSSNEKFIFFAVLSPSFFIPFCLVLWSYHFPQKICQEPDFCGIPLWDINSFEIRAERRHIGLISDCCIFWEFWPLYSSGPPITSDEMRQLNILRSKTMDASDCLVNNMISSHNSLCLRSQDS